MYGTSDCIIDTGFVYNFTSMREGYQRLASLIPPNSLGYYVDLQFDQLYAQYILNNDCVFKEFFDLIYCLYIGNDVYLIISNDNWSENLIESLLKLIQCRYGYNGVKITCEADYYFYLNQKEQPEFDPGFGLWNLDQDKERYAMILETFRLRSGGSVYYDESL